MPIPTMQEEHKMSRNLKEELMMKKKMKLLVMSQDSLKEAEATTQMREATRRITLREMQDLPLTMERFQSLKTESLCQSTTFT